MSNDDLQLNSIDRFVKTSERLVLEAHGSCEVPAGCGGVVLRWRDPNEGRPVAFVTALAARVETFAVDGRPVAGNRTTIAAGTRVLGLQLSEPGNEPGAFGLYAFVDLAGLPNDDDVLSVPTTGVGEWRFTTHDPGEGWAEPAFVDDHWSVLSATTVDTEAMSREAGSWSFERMVDRGVGLLELPASESVWIRHRFTMEAE